MQVVGSAGLDLIKQFEKCRLEAYADVRGVWTIGWGHTAGVSEGQTCTQQQADEWLAQDSDWASQAVADGLTHSVLQNEFDALTCFVYNVGRGAWMHSALRDTINQGASEIDCAPFFMHFVTAGGKYSAGLAARRKAEMSLFLKA